MDKVIITHEITETAVRTTVKLPGKRPISKRWIKCADDGALGKFKLDWNEDLRLDGWGSIARSASDVPDFL